MTALAHDESWHEERRNGIGGSDAAVIMGFGFLSPRELWEIKMNESSGPDLSDQPRVEWGTRLEGVIAQKYADNHPDQKIRRANRARWSKLFPFAFAHFDRLIAFPDGRTVPFEIKKSEREGEWGPDGSSQIPHYYYPQIQHQLAVYKKADFAVVAVLIGGSDYREYTIPRDDLYIRKLMDAEATFWSKVENGVPPAPLTVDDLNAAYPTVDGVLEATDELIDLVNGLRVAREQATAFKNEAEALRKKFLLAMGEHQMLCNAGSKLATITITHPEDIDEKKLRAEYPEIALACTRIGTTRTARLAS